MWEKVGAAAVKEARREIVLEQLGVTKPKVEIYDRASAAESCSAQKTLSYFEK